MNMFYKKYKQHKNTLEQLNRCRVSLQVLTVADITTSSGTEICSAILQGSKTPGRQSTYCWPLQKAISNKYWKLWKKCVQDTFCKKGSTENKELLGNWITEGEIHQTRDTYSHPSTRELMWRTTQASQSTWKKHGRTVNNSRLIFNKNTGITICPLRDAIKISLTSESKHTWIFNTGVQG